MGHVNNAAYVDYLEESISAAGDEATAAIRAVPRRVQIEYVLAAVPGSTLAGAAWRLDESEVAAGWAWRLAAPGDASDVTRGRLLPGPVARP